MIKNGIRTNCEFITFILTPWNCTDTIEKKCAYIMLSILFGIATLGVVHGVLFAHRAFTVLKENLNFFIYPKSNIHSSENKNLKIPMANERLTDSNTSDSNTSNSSFIQKLQNKENRQNSDKEIIGSGKSEDIQGDSIKSSEDDFNSLFSGDLWELFSGTLICNTSNRNIYYDSIKRTYNNLLNYKKEGHKSAALNALIITLEEIIRNFENPSEDKEVDLYKNMLSSVEYEIGPAKKFITHLKSLFAGIRGESVSSRDELSLQGDVCLNYFCQRSSLIEETGIAGNYNIIFDELKKIMRLEEKNLKGFYIPNGFCLDNEDNSEIIPIASAFRPNGKEGHIAVAFFTGETAYVYDNFYEDCTITKKDQLEKFCFNHQISITVTKNFYDHYRLDEINFAVWKSLKWQGMNCYLSAALMLYAIYDLLKKKQPPKIL